VGWWRTIGLMLTSRRLFLMLPLGFASGLPLALTGGALQAWLAYEQVDIKTIGLMTLVGLPYTLKFLWSPFMDRYTPRLLGRRRSWMLVTQLALAGVVALMATLSPGEHAGLVGAVALVLAFTSASQDIAFNAYQTEVLRERERGLGIAISVAGYRLGMLVSGGLALILADAVGWRATYLIMATFMAVGVVATLLAPRPHQVAEPPPNLLEALVGPLREFLRRPQALALLALVAVYRLGDTFASALTTAFLVLPLPELAGQGPTIASALATSFLPIPLPPDELAELLWLGAQTGAQTGVQTGAGFSQTAVGAINQGVGIAALLVGAALGGVLIARLALYRTLLVCGVLQCVTNVGYITLVDSGASEVLLGVVVSLENLAGGAGTTALIALIMALCDKRYTATQFALLTAITAIGRYATGPTSGVIAAAIGWTGFFIITALVALPGLWLVWHLRERIRALATSPPPDDGAP